MSDVTRILSEIEQGDPSAAEQLLPLVYEELRRLAHHRMAHESPDHTLQATALVHEAYLRLVDVEKARHWTSRSHFFAAAAEAMRRILVDAARTKRSLRRGGERRKHELFDGDAVGVPIDDNLLALDEALRKLETIDSEMAKLVQLRFFAGMTIDETAQAMGISPSTAKRSWVFARAWLRREMGASSDATSDAVSP